MMEMVRPAADAYLRRFDCVLPHWEDLGCDIACIINPRKLVKVCGQVQDV